MSAGILRALMQLFAIIAGGNKQSGREIVALFLRQQLNKELVNQYLALYDEFAEKHHAVKPSQKDQPEKRTSLNSVKILRICDKINEELAQKEKYFVLLRLLEFIEDFREQTHREWEFLQAVSDAFNIDSELFEEIKLLVQCKEDTRLNSLSFLEVIAGPEPADSGTRWMHCEGLKGKLLFMRLEAENIFFIRYFGKDELNLNGQPLMPDRMAVFSQGSCIRGPRINPIFYSDVLHKYLDQFGDVLITYRAENVSHHFQRHNKKALHQLNIVENSGSLLGIMGASGAGKSTLLNILNGNTRPSYGSVTINGYNIHTEPERIEGVLGYVSQDDLLIEELSVYQNLYYNARLCFADLDHDSIEERVLNTLQSVGLLEVRDLRVGSVLDKTISGGQRKRLNIALELIREPSVLFVDEPTSGLSSRDSENIMDLLKELTLRGKLVFVVIHQPSSDIFKMFDKLFILDQGGYPIYYGNPVESVVYFKKLVNHVNHGESECPHCGNVNPEQVFNIIEAKVVDEYGNLTEHRKISPREWNNFFNVIIGNHIRSKDKRTETPKSAFRLPSYLAQYLVFITRDVMSKLSNRQYMFVNLLEAPVLAFVLTLFIKYYPQGDGEPKTYSFSENLNIPQYLFISVIVALFLGLTVSAEEIIRDQKILKREKYLQLSKGSYLFAKISILFLISAIQSFCFVLVGNSILEVHDMLLPFWLVLFSTSCFANVLGLNISASFNSAKVIYIIIPILIIPQLLFSGVIVRFDRLFPAFASQSSVPLIGNVMASRWAYEAMAVYQFRNNDYSQIFYPYDQTLRNSGWKKDYWVKEMHARVASVRKSIQENGSPAQRAQELELIRNELITESKMVPEMSCPDLSILVLEKADVQVLTDIDNCVENIFVHYRNMYNDMNQRREEKMFELNATPDKKSQFRKLEDENRNETLEEFLTNKNDLLKIVEYEGRLVQKSNPVYLAPISRSVFGAQFYAPSKPLFGMHLTTISANLIVIWCMCLVLGTVLFLDGLKKFIDFANRMSNRTAIALRLKKEHLES